MAQCVATNRAPNKARPGQRCARSAVAGSTFCQHHGGLQDTKTPQKVRRRVSQPRIKCSRIKLNGEPCKRYARAGTTVCDSHGGKAPQTMAKAKERLFEAVDPVMSKLVQIALDDSRGSEQVRAATFLLERAGFNTKQELTVEVKPWEGMVQGVLVEDLDARPALPATAAEDDDEFDPLAIYAEEVHAHAAEAEPGAEVIPFVIPEVLSAPMPSHIRDGLKRRG